MTTDRERIRSLDDPEAFWRDHGSTLQWFHEPSDVFDFSAPGAVTSFTQV